MQLNAGTREHGSSDEDVCVQGNPQVPQEPRPAARGTKGRKDLFGLGNAVDVFATTILIKNNEGYLLERSKKACEEVGVRIKAKEEAQDPIQNQRLQSLVSGCLRAPDRLHKA